MGETEDATLFLVGMPGLEDALAEEVRAAGFAGLRRVPGGVEVRGGLAEAVRANLHLRRAVRVLWRVAGFRAMHLAQLDKRARRVPWAEILRTDVPVRVEAVCRKSRIYHSKAAAARVAGALEAAGIGLDPAAELIVKLRIEDDFCTLSIDTTGEALHRRGHKRFVGKAPLRETMAAAFLAQMGFDGEQAVVDPMCGSGTIPIEAAEIAMGLMPGRSRDFAFRLLPGAADLAPHAGAAPGGDGGAIEYLGQEEGPLRFFGYDRDAGAVRGAAENAVRARVARACAFECRPVSEARPPVGVAPGIVLVNPPYGGRIGQRKALFGLYGALGAVMQGRFKGWRVGVVTSDGGLAQAVGLNLVPGPPVDHSGTTVRLWQGAV
jgi:putative N6-adenine-specific DNA methylase